MRSFLWDRLGIQRHRHRVTIARGVRMRMTAGAIVQTAVLMDVLCRHVMMHMNHTRHMALAQTRSDGMCAWQRIRDRRRQHTKQIDQGDEPPCSHSLHSGKTNQHVDANALECSRFSEPGREHSREPCTRQDGSGTDTIVPSLDNGRQIGDRTGVNSEEMRYPNSRSTTTRDLSSPGRPIGIRDPRWPGWPRAQPVTACRDCAADALLADGHEVAREH